MLKAISLVRSYGDFKAVDDVSFTIPSGQIVGLLGHNGAGKTTVMRMLSGHLEPDSGTITVNDKEISADLKSFQRTLGYLPENLPVYPEMIVCDYLDYMANLKGVPSSEVFSEVRRVSQETGIQGKLLSPISSLSRGFKQRVGVAQALLGRPEMLILDEPTNGLDPTQTEQMRALIKEVAKSATVILSTHIMQEVDAVCRRVLILEGGKLAVDADLGELRKSSEIVLTTTLCKERLEKLLDEVETVKRIAVNSDSDQTIPEDGLSFRLTLADDAPLFEVGARIAQIVSEQGAVLYELRPVSRDLEELVREVGRGRPVEEIKDAA